VPIFDSLNISSGIWLELAHLLHINILIIRKLLVSTLVTGNLTLFLLQFMFSYQPLPFIFTFNFVYSNFLPFLFIIASYSPPNTYFCITIPKTSSSKSLFFHISTCISHLPRWYKWDRSSVPCSTKPIQSPPTALFLSSSQLCMYLMPFALRTITQS
jgi:hypothetical protein